MSRLRTLIALATGLVALSIAPGALAFSSAVGNSSGTPTANVCQAALTCTYVNFHNGKPADVVKHGGKLTQFSVNAGSIGGKVQLRILRPVGHGKFKLVHSSPLELIASPGQNMFAVNLKVKHGDVLGLSNDSSGIYMASAPSGTCVRYIQGPAPDGTTAKPNHIVPQLHLLLSADVSSA